MALVNSSPTNGAPSGGGGGGSYSPPAPAPEPTPAPAPEPTPTPTPTPTPATTKLTSAEQLSKSLTLIESKDWFEAEKTLKDLRVEDQNNPEVWNLSGFAARNMGDFKNSNSYYKRALSLDGKHKGALEYQGELFLKLKQPRKANSNLAKLKAICGSSCEEYRELKDAIKAYKKAGRR